MTATIEERKTRLVNRFLTRYAGLPSAVERELRSFAAANSHARLMGWVATHEVLFDRLIKDAVEEVQDAVLAQYPA